MKPTLRPGMPASLEPGGPPITHISPLFSFDLPTRHFSNVVFPHPLDPKRP